MRWATRIMLAASAVISITSSSLASFTTINPPDLQIEDTRLEIFSKLFGSAFLPTVPGSRDYTNGRIVAVRVEDVLGATLNGGLPALAPGFGDDDQLWQATFELAQARVIFGGAQEGFGYIDGSSGGTFHPLFSATGSAYNVGGSASLTGLGAQPLRWAFGSGGQVFSSKASDNSNAQDHLVTYRIDDLGNGLMSWLLMWDDSPPGVPSPSLDYNDLVVQISAAPVPEPAALAPLAVVAMLARRQRRPSQGPC